MGLARWRVAVPSLATCAALGLTACGSGSTKTVTVEKPAATTGAGSTPATTSPPAPPPTSTQATTPAHVPSEAPSRILSVANFLSPTGNLGCAIAGGVARCDIATRSWTPPARPSSCSSQVDYGQGIQIGKSGGATFVCAGDTTRSPGAPKLKYGTGTGVDGFVCVSREAGMTCTRATTGHGFTISAQGYKLF